MLKRSRRHGTIALLVAAASGMSGCCSEETGGWAAWVFGQACSDDPVRVEIVGPEQPVVIGEAIRLTLELESNDSASHAYLWDLDSDRRTDVRLDSIAGPESIGIDGAVNHTFPRAGRVRVGVEVITDRDGRVGRDFDFLDIDVRPAEGPIENRPPIAEFVVPEVVAPFEPFLLDASPSRDEDGTIEQYGWDVEGDPEPEFESPNPRREHAYATPGRKTITLTVRDDRGATAQAQRTMLVSDDDRAAAGAVALRANAPPHARLAAARRFSARVTGLFPARSPRPTARGLELSGLRGSGTLSAKLPSPLRRLGRLTNARWRGRLRFTYHTRTGIARLRGTLLARGRGRRAPRACLRLKVSAPPFGRPVRGRLTMLGGTRGAAHLRGSAGFTVARVSGPTAHLRGRLAVRERTHARGLAACRA